MLSCLSFIRQSTIRPLGSQSLQFFHTTTINSAARKGTREKARKKKVKKVVEKVGFIPHNQRGKDQLNVKRYDKHGEKNADLESPDNVYIDKYYKWRVLTFAEAIEYHRQTHHPTMYNEPEAKLNVTIELNMQGIKITRFLDSFSRMAIIPNAFDHGEDRQIIALAKGADLLQEASAAGAALVGGTDIIKQIQSGEIILRDYPYIIAHPNILPELVSVRGLLKKKFPSPRGGNLDTNIGKVVKQFLTGIQYKAVQDEYQKNFGSINTCIGTLNMNMEHLEKNLETLLKDIDSVRPKREGRFITKVLLRSPPSAETFKIDPFVYVPEEIKRPDSQSNEKDDDSEEAAAVEN